MTRERLIEMLEIELNLAKKCMEIISLPENVAYYYGKIFAYQKAIELAESLPIINQSSKPIKFADDDQIF